MGADFIGGACPMNRTREEAKTALLALGKSKLIAEVDNSTGDIAEWAEFSCDLDVEALPDDYTFEVEALEYAMDALNEVYDAYEGFQRGLGRRDCDIWYLGLERTPYLVTGALSWGDSPEMCDPIWLITNLGITA